MSALLVTSLITLGVGLAKPLTAQAGGPWYSHSWYISSTDANKLWNYGYNDSVWANAHCTNEFVVLDFGQVGNEENITHDGAYYGYGAYMPGGPQSFIQDDTIVWMAEQYAAGWWQASHSCTLLKVALGTNNLRECPFGNSYGTCTTSGAGSAWGDATYQFAKYVAAGWASQISVAAADDMETSGWDCAGPTRAFVDGYNSNPTATYHFEDYGDWFTSPGCWSAQDAYYVGWGASRDYSLPEAYYTNNSQVNAFVQVEKWTGSAMYPDGVMTTCPGGDPLPYPTCQIGGQTGNSPGQAWSSLSSANAVAGYPQGPMTWSTNIQFEAP